MTRLRIEEERRALMKEKFLAVGTVLLLFVLRLPSADAQVKSTGAVLGTAKDATGSVIAGARVTLKNADTSVSMATETNASGDYSFPVVPVGQYELTMSASGFKTTVLSAISVSALENVRLNVTLSVGPVSQQVTVTAAPAAVILSRLTRATRSQGLRSAICLWPAAFSRSWFFSSRELWAPIRLLRLAVGASVRTLSPTLT